MRKVIIVFLGLLLIGGGFFGYTLYKKYKGNNVKKSGYFLVPKDASLAQVLDSIKPYIADMEAFRDVAESKHLGKFLRAGRYRVKEGDDNTKLVNMLKAGLQTEDTFRIKDFDDVYQMIGRVARKTQVDSLGFVTVFDRIAQEKGLTSAEDLKIYFFSDT